MRLNFEISPSRMAELKELQQTVGAETMKDLVNNSLSLLEWAVEETAKGNEIASLNEEDSDYRTLLMPVLQRVAKRHRLQLAASAAR